MHKIAAVGDKDSVLGFSALGIDVFETDKDHETARIIHRLAQEDYAIIFITEQAAEGSVDIIARYLNEPYPAIIPIPGNQGGTNYGTRQLKRNVEKALGADILFGNEG